MACKTVYGHGASFPKSDFYHAFGNPDRNRNDLFSVQDPKIHASMRRMVASLYSVTTLLSYEKFVDDINRVLIAKLREFNQRGRVINIPKWMQFYAFDVIGEITVSGILALSPAILY